jgi:hypothetical protein
MNATTAEPRRGANGSEALDIVPTTPHPVHLLMSGVVMAVRGGHALNGRRRTRLAR